MAGHSKWSKVKHINGPLDQKRGQLFSKLAKEITVAAKMGGGDPSGNPRLRSVILSARVQSMPNLRLILTKNHRKLFPSGAVSNMFHRKERVTVSFTTIQETRLSGLVIEAGSEELTREDDIMSSRLRQISSPL